MVSIIPFHRSDVLKKQPFHGEPLPGIPIVSWKELQRDTQKTGIEEASRRLLVKRRRIDSRPFEQFITFLRCPFRNGYLLD